MQHGGDLSIAIERFGGAPEDWLDLSTGINPYPYPLPEDLTASSWTRLPDRSSLDRLLTAARKAYRVSDPVGLVAAPGTQALISLLPSLLPAGETALVAPTYGSHKEVWLRDGLPLSEGASIYTLPATVKNVLVVNPNNPDGRLTEVAGLLEVARTLGSRGGYLVIDEAFADVMPGASVLPHLRDEPVLVLRSFGKFFGLAGLRLGFLAAPAEICTRAAARLESWAVSGPALEIGHAALSDLAWQEAMQRQLSDKMADLTLVLAENGLGVFGGTPLYALAAARNAADLHDALARRRIWTRIFDYAPTWIRIGLPGSPESLARLSGALAEAMKEI